MIELPYSLVIEATEDPDFFGFYSTELEGFTGIGHSIEGCLYQAKWGETGKTKETGETKEDKGRQRKEDKGDGGEDKGDILLY